MSTRSTMNAGSQTGVSLVELMIAMTLGLFLIAGVGTVALGVRQSNRLESSVARMQEDARFAFHQLGRDMRMGDFWGCARPERLVNHLDDPDDASPPPVIYDFLGQGGVAGVEGGGNPDSLTLRSASGSLQLLPPYGPQASASLSVESTTTLAPGDVVMVTDCAVGDIFALSNVSNGGSKTTLVHNTGAQTPRNYNQGLCSGGANPHCLSKVYGQEAMLLRVTSITYQVGTGSDGRRALFRGGDELVAGVDDLQLLYGEDTNHDGTADRYLPANAAGLKPERLVSIRVSLTLQSSTERLSDANADGRLRRTFTQTVAIRNRTL